MKKTTRFAELFTLIANIDRVENISFTVSNCWKLSRESSQRAVSCVRERSKLMTVDKI